MIRPVLISVCLLGFLVPAATAEATWTAGGLGTGQGVAATMPAGLQPTASATSQNVTVAWPQSTFLGAPLGAYTGGGYLVRRYAQGGFVATVPAAACATTIGGSALTLQCIEAGVPFGSWQYTVRPVLATFTGDEGPRSATVAVATAAPVLAIPTRADPVSGQTLGNLGLSWSAVTGATGYNVYRRTSAGTYPATPLNGATPVTATTFTDPASGLAAATTYGYVVRAVAGSPAVESAASNERLVTPIARPAAPAGTAAVAVVAGAIDVTWSPVAPVAGYNVYRRTSAGTYNFASPSNGATLVNATSYHDATPTNTTTYRYTVRAVILGDGGAQVESLDGTESAAVTSDATPPAAPTPVTVTSGGNVWASGNCSVAAGTRYVNNAGKSAVGITAAVAAPEAGSSVDFSATTPGSTPVTATATAVASTTTTLNLTSLLDGTATVSARTRDAAGNQSAAVNPTNVVIKDVVVPSLTADYNGGVLGLNPVVLGNSECGASIRATKTFGGNVGSLWPAAGPFVITSGSSYSFSVEGPLLGLGSVTYSVTSTDRAGNLSGAVSTT